MKITVNGVSVPTTATDGVLHIQVDVDTNGEVLPETVVVATGGTLDCYKSRFTQTGNIRLHLFGDPP